MTNSERIIFRLKKLNLVVCTIGQTGIYRNISQERMNARAGEYAMTWYLLDNVLTHAYRRATWFCETCLHLAFQISLTQVIFIKVGDIGSYLTATMDAQETYFGMVNQFRLVSKASQYRV